MSVYRPTVITDTATEPITLAELKAQIRVTADATEEDSLLTSYITVARILFEDETCRTVHEKTLEWQLSGWPKEDWIILPRATPLIAISHLKYKDEDGTETTWGSSNYIADTTSIPGRLVLASTASWPGTSLYPVHPIRITYRAGIAIASPATEASESVKLLVKMLAAGLWEHREAEPIQAMPGMASYKLDLGARALLNSLVVHQQPNEGE